MKYFIKLTKLMHPDTMLEECKRSHRQTVFLINMHSGKLLLVPK